jgi:hypothetical protein
VRVLVVLALGLVAAGCGGVVGENSTTGSATPSAQSLLPAPAIEAVDRPATPDALMAIAHDGRSASTYDVCQVQVAVGSAGGATTNPPPGGSDDTDCHIPPEEQAKLEAQERERREALEPADGVTPRTIARLDLGEGRSIELAAWRTIKDQLCLEAHSRGGRASGSGTFGTCMQSSPDCTPAVCFAELSGALVAVTPADADRIELTLEPAGTRAYALTGPLVPGFDKRVFMVGLGDELLRAIDLYRGDERVGHFEKEPTRLAFEVCFRQEDPFAGGSIPSREEMEQADKRMSACMREHGAPAG